MSIRKALYGYLTFKRNKLSSHPNEAKADKFFQTGILRIIFSDKHKHKRKKICILDLILLFEWKKNVFHSKQKDAKMKWKVMMQNKILYNIEKNVGNFFL
jgi:hypothetical protein